MVVRTLGVCRAAAGMLVALVSLVSLASLAGCGTKTGGKPSVPSGGTLVVTHGDLDATLLLRDPEDRLRAFGAASAQVIMAGPLAEGERRGAFVEFSADMCLVVYGRASGSVEDVDVIIFSDEGAPLAIDESPDPRPAVMLCPPHPARVFVSVHLPGGEGIVAVGAQVVRRADADKATAALGVRAATVGPRTADAWPGLREAITRHRTQIPGPWQELRKTAVALDARAPTAVAMAVEAGECSDALILGGEELGTFDAEFIDADGRFVARAHDSAGARALVVCGDRAIKGTLSLRPHFGRGVAAVVLSRVPAERAHLITESDAIWGDRGASLANAMGAVEQNLRKHGYEKLSSKTSTLLVGRRSTQILATRAPCVRIDTVTGAPLSMITTWLWNEDGNLVGSPRGALSSTGFVCARKNIRVDVESFGGSGPYGLLVHRVNLPLGKTPPLAAARMLTAAPNLALQKDTMIVTKSLVADTLTSEPIHLDARQCAEVGVGVEGPGSGVFLRLVGPNGDELDRSEGDYFASVKGCQGGDLKVEIVASATVVAAVGVAITDR